MAEATPAAMTSCDLLREQAGLAQMYVAERIGGGQRQVSKIEHVEIENENEKVSILRGYIEVVSGERSPEYAMGDEIVGFRFTA